jgi:hypothetical protein
MDEFSWFVGLFEGEGTYYSVIPTGKKSPRGIMSIEMTDEDTIKKVADYLGVSYYCRKKTNPNPKHKPIYRVTKVGSVVKGELKDLMEKMYPYLSERRKTQLIDVWKSDPRNSGKYYN